MHEFSSLKDLAQNCRYIVLATVNGDGSPHNSPVFYIPSNKLDKLYIGTHPESLHAQNITRTGQAFGVMVGRTLDGDRGIYFKIENFHEVSNQELPKALAVHNEVRLKVDKKPITIDYYQAPNPQRMYVGDIVGTSTNDVLRDDEGRLKQDVRNIIDISEL